MAAEIQQVREDLATGKEKLSSKRTIFHQLLDLNAMQGHKLPSTSDITDEALVLITAAADTIGHALQVSTYHILRNEQIRLRLTEELKQAFPNPGVTINLLALEKLPYLVRTAFPLKSESLTSKDRCHQRGFEVGRWSSYAILMQLIKFLGYPMEFRDGSHV